MSGFWGTIQCNSCNTCTSTKSVTHRGDNIIECSNGRLLRICKDGRYACAACDPTISEYLQALPQHVTILIDDAMLERFQKTYWDYVDKCNNIKQPFSFKEGVRAALLSELV